MEKQARCARASEAQKEFLITYLQSNLDFAHDRFLSANGSKGSEQMWNSLANELNAIGGACKTGQKWKRYWRDLRQNTKIKYNSIRNAEKQTGNGIIELKPLTEMELKIVAIMTKQSVDGDNDSEAEIGLHEEPHSNIHIGEDNSVGNDNPIDLPADEDLINANRRQRKRRKICSTSFSENLLKIEQEKLQLETQKVEILKEISGSLRSIADSLKSNSSK